MEQFVTHFELAEFKSWLIDNFATKKEFSELKGEVSELKKDIAELRGDVAVLKYDVSMLKEDLTAFKQEMREFKNETIIRFDKVFGFLEKLDQERLFMHDALVRIEEKLSK